MNEKEISIVDLMHMLFSNKTLILVLAAIMAISAFVYSNWFVDPVYVAKGKLYVTIDNASATQTNANINDIMAAQQLTNTYIEILSSSPFYKTVCEEGGLEGYTHKNLKGMVSYSAQEESTIIQVSATAYSAEDAADIVGAVLTFAQTEIPEIVPGGSAKSIEPPEVPTSPASPNIPKNCIVATLLGIILGCAINFIKSYFDDSIKNIGMFVEKFNIPVLAEIPMYDESSAKK